MKTLSTFLILVLLFSCTERPNYNPFDDQFNISTKVLTKDGCDTISAQCGYFNLTKKGNKLRPYYQIFIEDYDLVVAKGFTYTIDTFSMDTVGFNQNYTVINDSLLALPIRIQEVNSELGLYGYQIENIKLKSIHAINSQTKDTIEINKYVFNENDSIKRSLHYFKSNPKVN